MYTYNPHWGSSLVASREATKGALLHPLFVVCPSLSHSFVYSFISLFLSVLSLSLRSSCNTRNWDRRETVCGRKFDFFCLFLNHFLSHFHLPGIPFPSLYSHRSFVIFGRVSDTLVCLGNRSGRRGRRSKGGEGTRRAHTWRKKVYGRRGKGDKVTWIKWI